MEACLPPELADVSPEVLEDYVRKCLLLFVRKLQAATAQSGLPSLGNGMLEAATTDTIHKLFPESAAPQLSASMQLDGAQSHLELRYRHDCKNIGCANSECLLCINNQNRRCPDGSNFNLKYIKNDLLRARCDASVRLELVDKFTGKVMDADLNLVATVLDAGDYAKRLDNGADPDVAVLQTTHVYTNGKGEALLLATGMPYDDRKSVVIPMQHGLAVLPDLRVSDSSEALRGRGASFRLLVQVQEGGPRVKYALSESFQVLSNRSKPNCKPAIPHVEDPVKNLEAIGDATVPKLERLKEAAREINIDLTAVPIDTITKVGEFRELVRLAATDRNLQDKLRKVLSLTKDQWKVAYEHAMKAVEPDHRLRIWYPASDRTDTGLVFECLQGNVLLDRPVGLKLPEGLRLEAHLASDPQERQRVRQQMQEWLPLARKAWFTVGHGNWATYLMPDEATALVLGPGMGGGGPMASPSPPPLSAVTPSAPGMRGRANALGVSYYAVGPSGAGAGSSGRAAAAVSPVPSSVAGSAPPSIYTGTARRSPSPHQGEHGRAKMMRQGGSSPAASTRIAARYDHGGVEDVAGVGMSAAGFGFSRPAGANGAAYLAGPPLPAVGGTLGSGTVAAGAASVAGPPPLSALGSSFAAQVAAAALQQQQQQPADDLAFGWPRPSEGQQQGGRPSPALGAGAAPPPSRASGAGSGDNSFSAFENPPAQFSAMLETILKAQQPLSGNLHPSSSSGGGLTSNSFGAPGAALVPSDPVLSFGAATGAAGAAGDESLKRKPSRALSELFTSMSLQALAQAASADGGLGALSALGNAAAAAGNAQGGVGSGALPSLPTGNVLSDLLRTFASLEHAGSAGLRETLGLGMYGTGPGGPGGEMYGTGLAGPAGSEALLSGSNTHNDLGSNLAHKAVRDAAATVGRAAGGGGVGLGEFQMPSSGDGLPLFPSNGLGTDPSIFQSLLAGSVFAGAASAPGPSLASFVTMADSLHAQGREADAHQTHHQQSGASRHD